MAELDYSLTTYPWLYALWSLALASWLAALVLGCLRLARARPVRRDDRWAWRFWVMLRDGVAQLTIWRRRLGGVMHLSISVGGVLLLTGFVVSHYVVPRGEAWQHLGWVHLANDLGVTLMLVGLAIAAWRRHVRRQLPAGPEDVATWGFLLLGVLLATLSNAALVAVAEPDWRAQAILSNGLAKLLGGLPLPTLRSLYGWSWSLLHVWFWGAVILLPWCKWRHMPLTPLSLFSRKGAPLARMDPLDLSSDEGPYGALRARDLTWKQRLDLAACTRCGRCTEVCPAQAVGFALDPLALIQGLGGARGQKPLAVQVGEAMLWDCTTCMACDDVCPVGISPLDLLLDLRRERVLDAARFPQPLQGVFERLEHRGNPWNLPRGERAAWASTLGLRVVGPGEACDLLIWMGCMGAYDDGARRALRALVRLLRSAGLDIGVLGADESCCGDAARRAGNEYLWRELAGANIEALSTRHIGRLVSLCPHCVNALANEYPALGLHADAVHATTLLGELLRDGRLRPDPERASAGRVAYHDPCYLGRGSGAYQAPRDVLAALPAAKLVELPHWGRDSLCCGAGGGQMWLEDGGRARLGLPRAEEIARAEAARCVTACPYCATMLGDHLRQLGSPVVVADLVELLAEALPESSAPGGMQE